MADDELFEKALRAPDPAVVVREMTPAQRYAFSLWLDGDGRRLAIRLVRDGREALLREVAFDDVPKEVTPRSCVAALRQVANERKMKASRTDSDEALREKLALARARHVGSTVVKGGGR